MEKWIPKAIALLILWGGVGYLVTQVSPEVIKDVGIVGAYLPMLVMITLATWYSALLLTKSWRFSNMLAILVMTTQVCLVMRWMNFLTAIALVGMTVSLILTLVKES